MSQNKTPQTERDRELERLRLQIDRLPLAYIHSDADGHVLDWNHAAEKMFGYTKEEILGRVALDLLVPRSAYDQVQEVVRRVRAGRTSEPNVNENLTKDGRIITCEWLNTPLVNEDGSTAGRVALAQDVTQRKRLEQQLEEERQRFQAIFENAIEAILLMDDAAHFVDGNPAACVLLGYSRGEIRNLHLREITPEQNQQRIPELLGRFFADGTLMGEYTLACKGGEIREVEYRSIANILPGLHLGVLREITERKQAEKALQQMAAIVESSDDAIFSKTLDGLILSWNRGAEKIYGYTAAEVIGGLVSLLIPPDRPNELPAILADLRQGRAIDHYETVRMTKAGKLIDVALTISPIRDREGRIAGASTIARDITEQRQAEKQLRESEERFRELAANIDGYFWLNAPDDSQMYYVSPGYEKVTGRSCESMYQHPESWSDIIHPEDRERILAASQATLREEGRQIEYRIVRPDGTIRWIRDRAFPVCDESGEVQRVAGIGEDITERKQAEQKIQEYSEQVQALSRRLLMVQEEERRRLARELHDEIGQTLTGLQLVLEEGSDLSLAETSDKLRDARLIVHELLATVRELSFELRPPILDHLGLLPALLWLLERYGAQTKVRAHFKHDGLASRFPPATETAAYRVVQEALTNVARHAGVNEVSVRVWVSDGFLKLQIEDAGAGFDPEAAMASGATAGLGGMRERVELLNGKLEIDSAPGQGTQVMAEFPLGS